MSGMRDWDNLSNLNLRERADSLASWRRWPVNSLIFVPLSLPFPLHAKRPRTNLFGFIQYAEVRQKIDNNKTRILKKIEGKEKDHGLFSASLFTIFSVFVDNFGL